MAATEEEEKEKKNVRVSMPTKFPSDNLREGYHFFKTCAQMRR